MEDGEGLNRLEQQRRSHELEHTALEISQIKHIGEKRNIRDFGETVGWYMYMYNYSPDKARDPLCTSKTCDKDNTKDEKGGNENAVL